MRADALSNRQALLDAARGAWAAGNDSMSLKQIAAAAGVGVGTAYRHFPTLQDLIDAAAAQQLALFEDVLNAPPPEGDSWATIDDAAHRVLELMLENFGVASALLREGSPAIVESQTRLHHANVRLLGGALPVLDERELDTLAADLEALICGIAMASRAAGDPRAFAHRRLALVLDGLKAASGRGTDDAHL